MTPFRLPLVLVVLAAMAAPVCAQRPTTDSQFIRMYARPQFPTIHVFVWGDVASPGVWRVEPEVDLVELLSAAGAARNDNEDRSGETTSHLRVYRTVGEQRSIVYERELAAVLSGGDYPALAEGDVVEVTTERIERRETLQTVTQIVGAASAVVLLIFRLVDLGS